MKRTRLLHIEDQACCLEFVQSYLAQRFEIISCTSAQEAIQKISAGFTPDVVLCSHELLHANCHQLVQEVLMLEPQCEVMISSEWMEQEEFQAYEKMGVRQQLQKPFYKKELEINLRRVFNRRMQAQLLKQRA